MFPIISSEIEKKLDLLAYDIVMFFQDYDWYEYCDVVDDLSEMPVYEFQRIMTVDEEFDKLISYFWNDLLMNMDMPPKDNQFYANEIIFSRLLNLFHDLYPEKQLSIQPKFDEFKKHLHTYISTNSLNSDLRDKFVLICSLITDNSDGGLDSSLSDIFSRLNEADLTTFESIMGMFDPDKSEDDIASLFKDSALSKSELKYFWCMLSINYDTFTLRQFINRQLFERGLERRA